MIVYLWNIYDCMSFIYNILFGITNIKLDLTNIC
jgi:hypothetical protein